MNDDHDRIRRQLIDGVPREPAEGGYDYQLLVNRAAEWPELLSEAGIIRLAGAVRVLLEEVRRLRAALAKGGG